MAFPLTWQAGDPTKVKGSNKMCYEWIVDTEYPDGAWVLGECTLADMSISCTGTPSVVSVANSSKCKDSGDCSDFTINGTPCMAKNCADVFSYVTNNSKVDISIAELNEVKAHAVNGAGCSCESFTGCSSGTLDCATVKDYLETVGKDLSCLDSTDVASLFSRKSCSCESQDCVTKSCANIISTLTNESCVFTVGQCTNAGCADSGCNNCANAYNTFVTNPQAKTDITQYFHLGGAWGIGTMSPYAREGEGVEVVGQYAYIFGGIGAIAYASSTTYYVNSLKTYRYSFATGAYTILNDMPQARANMAHATNYNDTKIYVIGGEQVNSNTIDSFTLSSLTAVLSYNIFENSWVSDSDNGTVSRTRANFAKIYKLENGSDVAYLAITGGMNGTSSFDMGNTIYYKIDALIGLSSPYTWSNTGGDASETRMTLNMSSKTGTKYKFFKFLGQNNESVQVEKHLDTGLTNVGSLTYKGVYVTKIHGSIFTYNSRYFIVGGMYKTTDVNAFVDYVTDAKVYEIIDIETAPKLIDTNIPDLPKSLCNASAFVYNTNLYVVGGKSSYSNIDFAYTDRRVFIQSGETFIFDLTNLI